VSRVARWFVFKPKIPIWVNLGLGYVVVIWYISPRFGILCQEKSGNPDCEFRKSFFCHKNGFLMHCEPGANPTTFEFTATTPAL
jgi:hypothetical protein